MPVPARLNIVTLGVRDLARSVRFYQALGWERCSSSMEEISWFRLAGSYIGLFPHRLLAEDSGLGDAAGTAGFGGITLAINVEAPEDVQPALDAAAAAGATPLKPATKADWGGVSGYFADPDGYPWEVAFNPAFPIRDDGTIEIP